MRATTSSGWHHAAPWSRQSGRGKVAVVTGGANGIGAVAGVVLAREGAAVAVTDLQAKDGEVIANKICAGGTAQFWRMDVSNEEDVERVFAEVAEAFGKVDVLINNAGIAGENKPPYEITMPWVMSANPTTLPPTSSISRRTTPNSWPGATWS